ncbi:MAG: hypothetical protein P8Y45_14750 [Exilibacterium sp.]
MPFNKTNNGIFVDTPYLLDHGAFIFTTQQENRVMDQTIHKNIQNIVLSLVLLLIFPSLQAAEIKLSGFASFVGGRAIKQSTLADGSDATFVADNIYANINGRPNDASRYSDKLSFRPDTTIGLQIHAALSQGLNATAQIKGTGANNFNADLEWAFLTYELSEHMTLQAGRMRLPLFFYSDFLDVGYAYHWIRPPTAVYRLPISSYEGASIKFKGGLGPWDSALRVYGGNGISENALLGDFNARDMLGIELSTSNSWLQLRMSVLNGDFFTRGTTTGEDNPIDAMFAGASVHMNLNKAFLMAEATITKINDDYLDLFNSLLQTDYNESYILSAGYEIGDFTPHISYTEIKTELTGDLNPIFEGVTNRSNTLIVGLRWDFHPAAALKLEYSSVTESDNVFRAAVGKTGETDIVNVGLDIVF